MRQARIYRRIRTTLLGAATTASLVFNPIDQAFAGPFEDGMAIIADAKKLHERTDDAIGFFRKAVDSKQNPVAAGYNLGLLLKRKGDLRGARAAWQAVLAADANHLPSRAQLAGLDLASPSTAPAAVKTLEGIIEGDRFQAEARNLLAAWELSQGRFDEAIRHGRNALLGDPENIDAFLNVAIAYYRKGLADQAGLIASSALEKNPKAASLHNLMGLVFLSQDNSRAATEAFTAAIDIDPSNEDARLNLAALELAYGNFDAALKRFDQVLKTRPDDPEILVSRAVALRGLSRFDEAEKGYRAALALPGADPDIEYNLCILHHQYTQKWQDALTTCSAYLARIGKDHAKHSEVARRVKAIEATIRALQNKPQ
jgi:tetratricopeptide (TPR) repeat protein